MLKVGTIVLNNQGILELLGDELAWFLGPCPAPIPSDGKLGKGLEMKLVMNHISKNR